MTIPSSLSQAARAECLGAISYGELPRVARKHGLSISSLKSFRGRNPEAAVARAAEYRRRLPLLTHFDVPPAGFGVGGQDHRENRWVASRKEAVVMAIRRGQITLAKARSDYGLSLDEFLAWATALRDIGPRALRASKGLQETRYGRRPS